MVNRKTLDWLDLRNLENKTVEGVIRLLKEKIVKIKKLYPEYKNLKFSYISVDECSSVDITITGLKK